MSASKHANRALASRRFAPIQILIGTITRRKIPGRRDAPIGATAQTEAMLTIRTVLVVYLTVYAAGIATPLTLARTFPMASTRISTTFVHGRTLAAASTRTLAVASTLMRRAENTYTTRILVILTIRHAVATRTTSVANAGITLVPTTARRARL